MNSPEWCYMLWGCVCALIGGAVQPAFAVIFAEILGVSTVEIDLIVNLLFLEFCDITQICDIIFWRLMN